MNDREGAQHCARADTKTRSYGKPMGKKTKVF